MLPASGQVTLRDGRTGQPFDGKVTVGVMYIMKLHHLVDEKIHARSIGPYAWSRSNRWVVKFNSVVSVLERWGVGPRSLWRRYTLQELLTVKSDDVAGRTRMFEAIVKGENVLEPGLPESFNVIVKELQSLDLMD